jgi:hypothetical protein
MRTVCSAAGVASCVVRRRLALLPLLLAACAQERTHPRLAELTSPVHITVRNVDAPEEKDCSKAASWSDRLSCWTASASRRGCTYASVGEAADLPIAFTGPAQASHCQSQVLRPGVALLTRGPRKNARLFVDGSNSRVVVSFDDEGWVLFLDKGRLVTEEQLWDDSLVPVRTSATPPPGKTRPLLPDGSPDWSRVPTLLSHLDAVRFDLTDAQLDALMRSDPDPQTHLRDALVRGGRLMLDVEAFDRALARLDEPRKKGVVDSLREGVVDGNSLAMDWFRKHPRYEREYEEALLEALRNGALFEPETLEEVARRAPAGLAAATCGLLEEQWHEGATDAEGLTFERVSVPLALTARLKLKCPWVVPLLESAMCDGTLRCVPPPGDDDPLPAGDLAEQQRPLCSDADQAAALARAFRSPTDEELEDDRLPIDALDDWGPLLLAAARVQGPLPAKVVARNERRSWKWKFVPPPGEEDGADNTCLDLDLARWVCLLPDGIAISTQAGCRLDLDARARTITFTELELDDAPR